MLPADMVYGAPCKVRLLVGLGDLEELFPPECFSGSVKR